MELLWRGLGPQQKSLQGWPKPMIPWALHHFYMHCTEGLRCDVADQKLKALRWKIRLLRISQRTKSQSVRTANIFCKRMGRETIAHLNGHSHSLKISGGSIGVGERRVASVKCSLILILPFRHKIQDCSLGCVIPRRGCHASDRRDEFTQPNGSFFHVCSINHSQQAHL